MQFSHKEKVFSNFFLFFIFFFFFLNFLNLYSILNIFQKKITLIAVIFFKLLNLKDVVRYMSENYRFTRPFHK